MCGNRSHKMVLRSREAKIKTYFNLLVQNMHTICIYILYIHIWKNNRTETVSVVFFLKYFLLFDPIKYIYILYKDH